MKVKGFTTIDEQISKLSGRGLIINDTEACKKALKEIGYYRLTAYLIHHKKVQNQDDYNEGVTFDQVKGTYDFDRKMRILILTLVEEIEIFLRSKLSYFHSQKYGPLGYTDGTNFSNKHDHHKFCNKIQEIIHTSKSPVIIHHVNKFGGKVPIWAMMEQFSLGNTVFFYKDLHTGDKKQFTKGVYPQFHYEDLESWLSCISNLRNYCAHYSRLYNVRFTTTPKIPSQDTYKVTYKLFDQVYVIKQLYFDDENWNNTHLISFVNLVTQYQDSINLDLIGFPEDWFDVLTKKSLVTV